MAKRSPYFWTIIAALTLSHSAVCALEINTELAVQTQFFNSSELSIARDQRVGVSLQPRIIHASESGNTLFTFEPFTRWEHSNSARSHSNIRELNVLHAFGDWEVQAGLAKVFWGVTESNHLVDIINQTDTLEGIDGEDKLGQPLLRLSRIFDQSTIDAYVLPSLREQAFLGAENRFFLGLPVDEHRAQFESEDGDNHIDYALRVSGYLGQLDYGLSWFKGSARQPHLVPLNSINSRFAPYYAQMEQWGLDIQYTKDAWLWKLEAISNAQSTGNYDAVTGGLEYTFYGLKNGLLDAGALVELHHDTRDDASRVNLQNDLFIGTRLAFNDTQSSSVLIGGVIDLDDDSTSFRIEGSRRVFNDAKLSVEAQVFDSIAPDNFAFRFRDNDFVQIELQFYF